MIKLKLLAALLAASLLAASGGAFWVWRLKSQLADAQQEAQQLRDHIARMAQEATVRANLQDASLKAANRRIARERAEAQRAREAADLATSNAAGRLQHNLDSLGRPTDGDPGASADRQTIATLRELLGDCSARYRALGLEASRDREAALECAQRYDAVREASQLPGSTLADPGRPD